MDQVHVIRHKVLVEGLGIRKVAREMGVSRNTVRKYLQESEPVRKQEKARSRPVRERIGPEVEALLEEWSGRTTSKQRITGSRVHRELVEREHEVGVTTVREILRERRRQRSEVFIPLVHRPGDEGQVDFFEVSVDIAGQRHKAWKFVMRLMHSGRDFVWLYDRCDQVAFLDGHVRAFMHFGAVPQRCIYDNLSAAVHKVMFPHRELTARFRALVSHYLFEPCFARPGQGHDKGGVEARGRGIRLQHLVPIPRAESLREICQQVLGAVDRQASQQRDRQGHTIMERFAEEVQQMLALPDRPFEARKMVPCTVSRSARVKVDGAHYSVPSHLKGLEANAWVGAEDVRIVCRGEDTTHQRKRFGEKSICYRHYLPELVRKPQALRQVAPELLEELGEPYAELWRLLVDCHGPRDGARVLARILEAVVSDGEGVVAEAIRRMLAGGDLGILPLTRREPPLMRMEVPEPLRGYDIESAAAANYDVLLLEASDEC